MFFPRPISVASNTRDRTDRQRSRPPTLHLQLRSLVGGECWLSQRGSAAAFACTRRRAFGNLDKLTCRAYT
jgi:hypothetical protein